MKYSHPSCILYYVLLKAFVQDIDILAKEKNNSTEKKYLDNSNENINDKVLIYFWDIIFFKESNPEILIFKITSLLSFLKQFLDLSKNSIYRWMTLSNTILFYIVFSV